MPIMTTVKFISNINSDVSGGGALHVLTSGSPMWPITLTVISSLFELNSAGSFGAISLEGLSLNITDTIFS